MQTQISVKQVGVRAQGVAARAVAAAAQIKRAAKETCLKEQAVETKAARSLQKRVALAMKGLDRILAFGRSEMFQQLLEGMSVLEYKAIEFFEIEWDFSSAGGHCLDRVHLSLTERGLDVFCDQLYWMVGHEARSFFYREDLVKRTYLDGPECLHIEENTSRREFFDAIATERRVRFGCFKTTANFNRYYLMGQSPDGDEWWGPLGTDWPTTEEMIFQIFVSCARKKCFDQFIDHMFHNTERMIEVRKNRTS